MMNRIFFIVIAALIARPIGTLCQNKVQEEVRYTYDNAGNRIKRAIVLVSVISPNKSENESKGDFVESEIHVYPNPVKEELTIEIWKGNDDDNYRFLMFDISGKMIKEVKQQGNGKFPFDMSMYQFGTYLLIIETGNGKREFKVIKE